MRAQIIDTWRRATVQASSATELAVDDAFVDRLVPWMRRFSAYFDSRVRGLENVPQGPVLLVGNHSGGVLTPDTSAVFVAWREQRPEPLSILGLDAAFTVPGLGSLMRKIGAVPASHAGAEHALSQGASVIVYPGGAEEVFRPYRDRHRVDFRGRSGFVRLALRNQIPVVPVVGHGGHETLFILGRGERISRWVGLDALRVNVFPIVIQAPWGLSTGGMPMIPLPARITVQVESPMDWSHLGPEAADDPGIVRRCADEIEARMQGTLDTLVAEDPHPLRDRLIELATPWRA